MHMSKESRKIYELLHSELSRYDIETRPSPMDVIQCDIFVREYYAGAVVRILKMKFKNIRNVSAKHGTLEYWMPMLSNMMKSNTSARRPNILPKQFNVLELISMSEGYETLMNTIACDYPLGDIDMVLNICNTYKHDSILYACKVAASSNVYDIHYINAILIKEQAVRDMASSKLDAIAQRAVMSESLLNREIHKHDNISEIVQRWKTNVEIDIITKGDNA